MTTNPDLMARAADRAAHEPFYLAHELRSWLTWNPGSTYADLAAAIGLEDVDQLPSVALCRRPTSREDCEQIAARFGCSAERLAEVCGL